MLLTISSPILNSAQALCTLHQAHPQRIYTCDAGDAEGPRGEPAHQCSHSAASCQRRHPPQKPPQVPLPKLKQVVLVHDGFVVHVMAILSLGQGLSG